MPIPTITLVHAPACHFCADAEEALVEVGKDHLLRVDLVAAESEAGQALLGTHRPAMLPLVLVDGVYFSQGRLPRRKLRALLSARPAVGTP